VAGEWGWSRHDRVWNESKKTKPWKEDGGVELVPKRGRRKEGVIRFRNTLRSKRGNDRRVTSRGICTNQGGTRS